jgi:DNA mismatch repair protein MutS2
VNAHALEVLELDRTLSLVAERAASPMGRAAVMGLRPAVDLEAVRRELERVAATMAFIDEKPTWGPPTIPDCAEALQRLRTEGSVLEPGELYRVGVLLAASRSVAREFTERKYAHGPLGSIRDRLVEAPELEEAIARTVDAEGQVLDTASRELKRIRGALKSAHGRVVKALEAYLRTLPSRWVVPDASVTVREGRYVIPLRREGRGEVGGIVHDESGSGATIFVEPPAAIELMNELRELERDEQREVRRVLRELSAGLRPLADPLLGALEALVDLDSLHARARVALAWRGHAPEMRPTGTRGLRLVEARHPLLLAGGGRVVPYDLELADDERTLIVSGPNTGGKSVFLKAVGLLSVLAQSGIVPPLGRGSVLPVFDDVFADIGDEQSISESLSTFSAHLENLREIVTRAGPGSLVLMDEMGTGTDPTEGAALARSLLEELTARGAFSIATSHLGALKTLDDEGSGIVNASLQFDPDRMEPTYRLLKGRPGRSYGLAIARRSGFPASLLDRAEALVDEGAASLEDLLERLEVRERAAAELQARLEREVAEADARSRELSTRERDVSARERELERSAREEARKLLLDAREEVERAIRDVRTARDAELEDVAHEARRRVEGAAREQVLLKPRAAMPELSVGTRVRLPGAGGSKGTVVEVRDRRAIVEVGGLRMELPAVELEPLDPPGPEGGDASSPETDRRRERGWSGDLPDASYEIDLRGLRVDEVELELGRGLDGAQLNDLAEVRVVHGKGTGAVRGRVEELLKRDGRVSEFRLGGRGEGGSGVTVVRLR